MTTPSSGRSTRAWKRLCAWAKDNLPAICARCGGRIDLDLPKEHRLSWTLDHIIPRVIRPDLAEDPANVVPMHRSCNSSKGARTGPPVLPKPPPTSRRWG
ncbi:HNH endonuclease [Streptomyces sp. NPDC015131]|uniref:HNH endonuclease n=1 Tax=Streptomyces sp. NPDC015131 TaxID=3364941 RepID=UPI0036FBD997